MPRPHTLVTLIQSVPDDGRAGGTRPGIRAPAVVLPDGKALEFDPSLSEYEQRAQRGLLRRLQTVRRPTYLVLNREGQLIDVRVPSIGRVTHLQPVAGGAWSVSVTGSSARFIIDRIQDPDNFAFLEANATRGVAIVRDRRRGLDVHAIPSGFVFTTPEFEELTMSGREVLESTTQLESIAVATRVFNDLLAQSCPLLNQPAGCIPFRYPYDGCEARAHRMAEILWARPSPITVGKAWQLGGGLRFDTDNAKCHFVEWDHHTAVFLRVKVNGKSEVFIFDPSMFSTPVPHYDWTREMGGRKFSVFTERRIFIVDPLVHNLGRVEDPDPEGTGIRETDRDLLLYAGELERASNGGTNPPFPTPTQPC